MTSMTKTGMLVASAIACLILSVESGKSVRSEAAVPDSTDIYRLGGIAQYDEDNFESAVREYRSVVRLDPTRSSDHLNLGLALMESNELEAALIEFQEALRLDPGYTHIYYNLGICHKRLGQYRQASEWLAEASTRDSTEVAIWYNLGVCYRRIDQMEESRTAFEKVLELNPYNVNAHYNLMRLALGEKDRVTYERERKIFRELKAIEPPSDLPKRLEICKYSYMIDLAEANPPTGPYTSFGRAVEVRFTDASEEFGLPLGETSDLSAAPEGSGLLPVDINRDGFPDLLVWGGGGAADGLGLAGLYVNNGGKGLARSDSESWNPSLKGVIGCIAADYDNDDDTDIYCLRDGPNLLYRNAGGGRFVEVAEASGVAGADSGRSVSALWQDHDNDGDLDIVVAENVETSDKVRGRVLLYRNNSDGSFSEIGAEMELNVPHGPAAAVAALDYDNDNDSDLLVLGGGDRPKLFSNRLWAPYQEVAVQSGLDLPIRSARSGDYNNDGHMDLLVRLGGGGGMILLVNDGGGRFVRGGEWGEDNGDRTVSTRLDYDNDGFTDLLWSSEGGIRLMRGVPGGGGTDFQDVTREVGLDGIGTVTALAVIDVDGDRDDDLVTLGPGGLKLFRNDGGNRNNSILVNLHGQKNNHDGIGSRVEVKAGRFYQKQEATGPYLRFGIGSLEQVDVVRVWWANNVIQNARNVGTDSSLNVLEKPGVLGSCPYVYAFDGDTYRFVSDALVTSTMGFYLAPDVWFPPDGDEYVIIPAGMVDEADGIVRLAVTEELREITYIDQLKLTAVDFPAGSRPFSNEIFHTSQPEVRFHYVDEDRLLTPSARSGDRDVTRLISSADGRAFSGEKNYRYDGITEAQSLVLELDGASSRGNLSLLVTGWVGWTNSSINRSIWQNGELSFRPPSLQVSTGSGGWRTILPEMGFPPGWFKTTIIDLAGLIPEDAEAMRILTNLDIHWDEIKILVGEPPSVSPAAARPPLSARLRWRGYSRTEYGSGARNIDFIWSDPLPDVGWPSSRGQYTRYGDVLPRVAEVDNNYVVMNHGEAVMVEFPAFGPPRPGYERRYILYLAGWCKDGDPNSQFSQTVEPLPGVPLPQRRIDGDMIRSSRTPRIWDMGPTR
ncbi:FG-GAP-like repeat-containing protein [candidate division KSB1 bacterium]